MFLNLPRSELVNGKVGVQVRGVWPQHLYLCQQTHPYTGQRMSQGTQRAGYGLQAACSPRAAPLGMSPSAHIFGFCRRQGIPRAGAPQDRGLAAQAAGSPRAHNWYRD